MAGVWTMDELVERVRRALAAEYPGAPNGRVRDLPDRRAIRWYTTTGLVAKSPTSKPRTFSGTAPGVPNRNTGPAASEATTAAPLAAATATPLAAATAGPLTAATAGPLGGVALRGGAILVLPAAPAPADYAAIAAAAEPLLDLLADRGLLNTAPPNTAPANIAPPNTERPGTAPLDDGRTS
jgi:hypothetical protein